MAKEYPNPQGEIVCCVACGRDTKAKSAYCSRCGGRGSQSNEQAGRSSRSTVVIGGQAEMLSDEDEEERE